MENFIFCEVSSAILNLLKILWLILWSIYVLVTHKYCFFFYFCKLKKDSTYKNIFPNTEHFITDIAMFDLYSGIQQKQIRY